MSALDEAEQLLRTMTRAEKAQLLQCVARDLGDAFPGIESDPRVLGGEPCIVRMRISVWLLVRGRELGASEREQRLSAQVEQLQNVGAPPAFCATIALLTAFVPMYRPQRQRPVEGATRCFAPAAISARTTRRSSASIGGISPRWSSSRRSMGSMFRST